MFVEWRVNEWMNEAITFSVFRLGIRVSFVFLMFFHYSSSFLFWHICSKFIQSFDLCSEPSSKLLYRQNSIPFPSCFLTLYTPLMGQALCPPPLKWYLRLCQFAVFCGQKRDSTFSVTLFEINMQFPGLVCLHTLQDTLFFPLDPDKM